MWKYTTKAEQKSGKYFSTQTYKTALFGCRTESSGTIHPFLLSVPFHQDFNKYSFEDLGLS